MNRNRVPVLRIVLTTAAVLGVALLTVSAAAAKSKPPHPPGHAGKVPCGGQAALVAAINSANSAGGGTLRLAHGCDYQLTSADNGENGLPVVTTAITIDGNHATIDGTKSVRVLEVDGPGGSLSLRDLTITGGSADVGGGIANMGGTVTLDRTRVTGNTAEVAGGGIVSATFDPSSVASLTVRHSSVSGNQQTLSGMQALGGGGIANILGTAKVDHSKVNGNTAQGFVGGGIANGDYFNFSSSDSVLTVEHSQVNGNTAPNAGGGGIQNLLGSVTLGHSQVDRNTSLNGGGISSGNGNGGLPPGTAHLVLRHSEIKGNTATAGPTGQGPPIAGGGLANGSVAVLDHSKVDGNKAPNGIGAGIVNHGTMTVTHSEVNRNVAAATGLLGSGGGIVNAEGPPGSTPTVLTVIRSRINHNSAGGDGGGIANGVPLPGPMPLPGGDVTLKNSNVMHNTAAHGGGIFNSDGTVTLTHTRVTHNHVDNCEPTNSIAGCSG